jgi:hypothetical protein
MNKCHLNTELSSLEGTRSEFNRSTAAIKLGIDVHQDFYVVVKQEAADQHRPTKRYVAFERRRSQLCGGCLEISRAHC